jgi:hypothetical protein
MKVLVSLLFAFFAVSSANAASSGKKLKAAVEKLNTCVGVAGLDGYVLNFGEQGVLTINTLTEDSRQIISEYAVEFGYSSVYNKFLEVGEVRSSVVSNWKVDGQKVLVTLNKKSGPESLIIGLKSQFCYPYVAEN